MTRVRAQAAVDAYAARESGRFRRSLHTAVEISDMLALSERDLRDRAPRFPDDPGGEYKELYDACVVAANALVDAYGYVTSGDGGHEAALHAAEGVMRSLENEAAALDLKSVRTILRPRRHAATYEGVEAVGADDVRFARELAEHLCPQLWAAARDRIGLSPPVS